MTAHDCQVITPGCYRCDLNKDEMAAIREEDEALSRFLLARIAEDEASVITLDCVCPDPIDVPLASCPDRILTECEAKKQIVEEAKHEPGTYNPIVAILAAVYADHPDYRTYWRP